MYLYNLYLFHISGSVVKTLVTQDIKILSISYQAHLPLSPYMYIQQFTDMKLKVLICDTLRPHSKFFGVKNNKSSEFNYVH